MPEILIADDERLIRNELKRLFVGEGYSVRTARDGEEALALFSAKRPDIVLLDVMMPRLNGFVACEKMRRLDGTLPILFLTAKSDVPAQLRALSIGADDYIDKLADSAVLLARVKRALERRCASFAEKGTSAMLQLGAVAVDLDRHLVSIGGKTKLLTMTETDLLKCLASRRGEVCSTDEILSFIRGENYVGDPTAIRVHVKNLRRKLGPAGDMIVNVINAGYYLVR